MVLSWALAGCGLGNPELVVAADGGDITTEDVGFAEDIGALDVGGPDVGGPDVGRDAGRDVTAGDVADAVIVTDVPTDVGAPDVVMPDVVTPDVVVTDNGMVDSGTRDTGPLDTGMIDTGPRDSGPIDTGVMDVGTPDVGTPDVGTPDVGTPDVGTPDAGPTVVGAPSESCTLSGAPAINGVGRYVMTGTTAGRTNDHHGTCAEGTDDNPDVGYLVTLSGHSRLSWTVRPTTASGFVPVVYVTQNCAEYGGSDDQFRDEVACVSNGGFTALTGGGAVDLPAGSYYLVVDGYRASTPGGSGGYEVTLDVSSSENGSSYNQELVPTLRCAAIPSTGRVEIMDGDDMVSGIQGLGFSFNYFGRAVDRLAFSTNGFLMFITSETAPYNTRAWRNHSIPFTGQPRGVVAPFWDDLTINGSADVYFWIDGPTGARVAHVSWQGARFYRDPGDTTVSFEARFFQGTNVIEFVYCSENREDAFSRGGSATIGLESYDQTQGRLVSLNRVGAVAPNTGYRFTPR